MNPPSLTPERSQRLAEVVAAYWHFVEKGQTPDAKEWCAHHADLLPELAEYLETQEKVDQLLAPLRQEGEGVAADGTRSVPATLPRLFGEYELLAEIARGGMGVVYQARESATGRIVALKMIRAGELASGEEVERFQREAQLAAGLDHPRIVPIYHVGRHEGQPFFTMKLIDGPNLNACLQAFRGLPGNAARLLASLARAVHHAHQRGLLHRDLKPANVLLDADGEPHITDFGLARHLETGGSLTQTGFLVGTLGFMAPEQALGQKKLTSAVDIYGLGAILYSLLTGQAPFQSETVLATLRGLAERRPIPPRRLNPLVERDLEVICLKCLEEEPARRYVSAAALAADLERYIAGLPILARSAGPLERAVRWVRRRPGRVAMAAGALLLLAAVFLGGRSVTRDNDELRALAADRARKIAVADYAHVIRAASKEMEDWNVPEAERLLMTLPDPPVQWEGSYLKSRCRARLRLMEGYWPDRPWNLLDVAAISPQGKYVAAAISLPGPMGRDVHEIRLWDLPTGKLLHKIPNTVGPVRAMQFTHDGQYFVVGRVDMRGNWNHGVQFTVFPCSQPDKGESLHCLEQGHFFNLPLVLAGDRNPATDGFPRLFAGLGSRLWEAPGATDLAKIQGITALALSPDHQTLAVGKEDAAIDLFDWRKRTLMKTLRGHAAPIHSLAFLDQGKRLASTAREPWVRSWDLTTGEQDYQFRVDPDRDRDQGAPTLSAEGRRCLVKVQGGASEIRALDGRLMRRLPAPGARFLSPDGRFAAAKVIDYPGRAEAILAVWDLDESPDPDGPSLLPDPLGERTLRKTVFRSDGRLLTVLMGNEDSLDILELPGEKFLHRIEGQTGWIGAWDLRAEHNLLVTAAADRLVRVWDLGQAKARTTLVGMAGSPRQVLLSPDGKLAALLEEEPLGRGKVVRAWDVANAKPLFSLNGWNDKKPKYDDGPGRESFQPNKILFTPDSQQLVLAMGQEVIFCEARTGLHLKELDTPRYYRGLDISPDGKKLVHVSTELTGPMTLLLRDLEKGTHRTWPLPFDFFDGGFSLTAGGAELIFAAEGKWRRWNLVTGKEVQAVPLPSKESLYHWGLKDQRLVLAFTRSLRELDLASGKEIMRFDLPSPQDQAKEQAALVASWRQQAWPKLGTELNRGYGPEFALIDARPDRSEAVSPDGVWTVFCPERYKNGKSYRPLDFTSRNKDMVLEHGLGCSAVAFSPDSRRLVSAGLDGTLRLWSLPQGSVDFVSPAADHLLERVFFNPDGQYLFCLYGRDLSPYADRSNTLELKVWDLARRQAVFSLPGVTEEMAKSLVFHPDGRRLACVDRGQVKLFDVPTLQEVLALPGGPGSVVAFSPDGRTLGLGLGETRGGRFWKTPGK